MHKNKLVYIINQIYRLFFFKHWLNLTLKNVAICPAAFNIVEKMKEKLPL